MERLAARDLRQLLAREGQASAPHVSIYVPLGATAEERERARERLARLVSRAETMLLRHYPQVTSTFVKPLKALAERLAKLAPAKGIAVFCSPKRVAYVPLERKVGEMAVVADSFHVKPLLPLAQAHEAFYLLALSPGLVRLFEGNSEWLDEKEAFRGAAGLAGAKVMAYRPNLSAGSDLGGRDLRRPLTSREIATFYADVDKRLRKLVGRRRTPVVLVGSEEMIGLYRSLSRVGTLASKDIRLEGEASQGIASLHDKAWPIACEAIVGQRRRLTRSYKMSRLRGQVVERLDEVSKAAKEGRIETLFIEAGVHVWGRIEPEGSIRLAKSQDEGPADDLLDDLAEMVLSRGGKVHVLGRSEMPAKAPAVAVLRQA